MRHAMTDVSDSICVGYGNKFRLTNLTKEHHNLGTHAVLQSDLLVFKARPFALQKLGYMQRD